MTTIKPFSSPIDLLKKVTSTSRPDEAVCRLVSDLRKRAAGVELPPPGIKNPPYDPRPFAELLGAAGIRGAEMDVAGRVVFDEDDVIVEFSRERSVANRRRFTIAHEVGHLALWEAERKLIPGAKPRNARGQAVERLCDEIATELLAPRDEIIQNWRAFCAKPVKGRIFPDYITFIERLAEEFRISLHMSAIRFVETCASRHGVGLLDSEKECFVWCYQIPGRGSLLRFLLSRHKTYSETHPKLGYGSEELFHGSGTYPLMDQESGRVPVEWRALKTGANLCLVVVRPQTVLRKSRHRRK